MKTEKQENLQVIRIYNQFMQGITAERAFKELISDDLRRYRIIRVSERRIARLAVYLLNVSNNGMIAEYRVRIGEFRVYVKVLNMRIKAIVKGKKKVEGFLAPLLKKVLPRKSF
jgi:hypothetical protein